VLIDALVDVTDARWLLRIAVSRRRLLKGLGVSLAILVLNAMLARAELAAHETIVRDRMAFVFVDL